MLLDVLIFFCAIFVNVIVGVDLEVGEKCTPKKDVSEDGICVLVTDCEEAIRYIKKRNSHPFKRCGFKSRMEIVCCPKNTIRNVTPKHTSTGIPEQRYGSNTPRIVDKQCKKIVNDSIPPLDLHIIGGENAQLGEFPHMFANFIGILVSSIDLSALSLVLLVIVS